MSDAGLELGDQAPDFELPDVDGKLRALDGVEPAPATVVIWTCNHCPYALAWHDRILDVARDHSERESGVRFLQINSNDAERYPADSAAAMRQRWERAPWPMPYLHDADQSVARAFGAQTTPDLFVLDAERRLAYRGAPDADHQDPELRAQWLRDALDAVLAGERPDPAETDPVGCGIKWK